MLSANQRRGLTWIEVLVILVVIGLLLAVTIPAMTAIREHSRRNKCGENLRCLGMGLCGDCVAVNHRFPLGTVANATLRPEKRLSWYVGASGFLHGQEYLVMQLEEPWDSPANLRPMLRHRENLTDEVVSPYPKHWLAHCPSLAFHSNPSLPEYAAYVGIAGLGQDAPTISQDNPNAGVWGYDRQTRPDDITRGLSSTLLVAETMRENGPWTAGGHPTVRGLLPETQPLLGDNGQFGGLHPGGGNVLFADGSSSFIGDSIDPSVFAAMATIRVQK